MAILYAKVALSTTISTQTHTYGEDITHTSACQIKREICQLGTLEEDTNVYVGRDKGIYLELGYLSWDSVAQRHSVNKITIPLSKITHTPT
jgi:hypothetical protein